MSNFEPLPRTEDEILEHVYRRAAQLRRPRMIAHVVLSTMMVGMLGGGMVLATHRGETIEPANDGGKPTLVNEDDEKPKPERKKEASKPSPEPTKDADEKPEPKESTLPKETPKEEPKLECFNSFNPDCGWFYWKYAPEKNQPLAVEIDAPNAVAGAEAAFVVSVSDADAAIWREAYKIDFGDGTRVVGAADKSCKKGYGKWTLPARDGDSYTKTFTHTYAAAGTYTVMVHYHSKDVRDGASPCQQAYGSEKTVMLTVVVSDPAPEPSPSGT